MDTNTDYENYGAKRATAGRPFEGGNRIINKYSLEIIRKKLGALVFDCNWRKKIKKLGALVFDLRGHPVNLVRI